MRHALISTLLLLVLVACGGGGSGDVNGASDPVLIDGIVFKGNLAFADLTVHVLKADGSLGALLGATQTFSRGQFSFLSLKGTPTGYIYVETSGGSYVDEATGQTVNLTPSQGLCAVVRDDPSNITVLAITPLTTMAAKRILSLATSGTPLDLAYESATTGVEQQYGLPDILSTFPADPTDADATDVASRQERQYGIVVAGIAELAAGMGMSAVDLTAALTSDAQDGMIDANLLPDLQDAINTIAGRTMANHRLAGHVIAQAPVPLGVASGDMLRFTVNALPAWISGQPASVALGVAGGTPPYEFDVFAGSLPAGFELVGSQITGQRLLAAGTTHFISAPFTLRVRDSANPRAEALMPTHIQVTSPPPQITCLQPPPAQEGVAYDEQIANMIGLHPPFYFSPDTLRNGTRPPGLGIWTGGRLRGTPTQGVGGGTYTFGVCGVDLIGNQDCCLVTVLVQADSSGGDSGGGGPCDGTYDGTFSANSPIGPSSGPIQVSVMNGIAQLVPPGPSFGGNVDGGCVLDGFWNNCPGAGCVNFPVTGTFSTTGTFQLSGQNATGSESVTITLAKQ